MGILRGLLGVAVLLGIGYLFSNNRKKINWRTIGVGMGIQLIMSLLILKVDIVRKVFSVLAEIFVKVLNYGKEGSTFLFGDVMMNIDSSGFIFAIQILPTIIFFSALTALMYHWGILQKIIEIVAWLMKKTMRISGVEGLIASANIFIGQSETPLLIKPYLSKMPPSQMFSLMVCGFATIAGGVLAITVSILGDGPEEQAMFAMHLMSASVMSAPAALVMAKMMYPNVDEADEEVKMEPIKYTNGLDAISNGTVDGLKLAAIIGAVLIVFVSLVAMVNGGLSYLGNLTGLNDWAEKVTDGQFHVLKLEVILGWIGAPIAWIMGVANQDLMLVGQLLGEKTILNEVIGYQSLANFTKNGMFASEKSVIIATYALCGFANIGSIGIQIGGISSLAPNQKSNLAKMGVKALIAGSVACFLTATIAGMIAG